MIETDAKLSDLVAKYEHYPQACINVKVTSKPPLESLPQVQEAITNVESILGDSGRVLVRCSGTENLYRVMVEGKNRKQVDEFAESIAKPIKEAIGAA